MDRDQSGIAAALSRMADGLGRLIGDHLALARLEMTEDARAVGKGLAQVALFVPLVLVGWALLCVAASIALIPVLGEAGAPACVGLLNVAVGSIGIGRAVSRMRQRHVLDDSLAEAQRSATALSASLEAEHGT